jgi:hypothetical protein
MLKALKNTNLALAFFLELAALIALGNWGFQAGAETFTKILLGVGMPLAAIVIWALFGAPRSNRRLPNPWLMLLRAVFFGSGVVAVFAANQPGLGLVFAVLVILNLILIYLWAQ